MAIDEHKINSLRIDRRPSGHGRTIAVVVIAMLVVGGAGTGGFIWWKDRTAAVEVRTVAVVLTASGSGDRTLLNASGYVTARRDATVSSKVTGKVVEVLVEEGMRVDEGQVLARIDASNVDSALGLANAQLAAARSAMGETDANLAQARREFDRLQDASRAGAATPVELQRSETLVRALEARLARQRADVVVSESEVAVWQQQLEDTVIRAPFAGIVTAKNAQPGEMISPMSVGGFTRTGICTIVDMDSLEIEVDVNESYINRVVAGQQVVASLDSYPDWRIPARVIAIIPTADRQKATVKVRVGFDALDPRMLPDMSVKVAFQGPADTATRNGDAAPRGATAALPASVLVQRGERDVVWVVHEGVVERRAVTVAERRGDSVMIAAGLRDGERVVVDPPDELKDEARVKEAKR